MALSANRHSERGQECFVEKTENKTMTQSEESITLVTSYRFPHHDNRSFTFVQDDVLPSYTRTMDSAAGRSSLAHVVRLRILACRNDLNRKRIVSLQLTAHS